MRILGSSGSLRAASSNTAVLHGMITLDLPNLEFELFSQLSELPHYNPDLDVEPEPSPVQNFRSELRRVQAVVISTPEYAHSLPGPLKNALDWIVRSGELYEKPVAIVNPSPRSAYAQAALVEVLRAMGAKVIDEAAVTLYPSGPLALAGILAAPSLLQPLRAFLDALLQVTGSQDGNQR
jgi:chromate reductase, NAD(P)H dehydrogenase (quinone)